MQWKKDRLLSSVSILMEKSGQWKYQITPSMWVHFISRKYLPRQAALTLFLSPICEPRWIFRLLVKERSEMNSRHLTQPVIQAVKNKAA